MRKLTVDEIIQGLVDAYERLLKLEAEPYDEDGSLVEYHQTRGEVKALRWVLGQSDSNDVEKVINVIEKHSEEEQEE